MAYVAPVVGVGRELCGGCPGGVRRGVRAGFQHRRGPMLTFSDVEWDAFIRCAEEFRFPRL